MMHIRRSEERGPTRISWLDSKHTFSFGEYHDDRFMGFGPLRVINEDRVAPGQGFQTHGHRDMEIVSYVLGGALAHKDSLGTGSTIRPGDVQRMSAGTGIRHSEFNASDTQEVHFLQIWILPEAANLPPGYEQKAFTDEDKRGQLRLVGSHDARDGSVKIHQDVDLYAGLFNAGEVQTFAMRKDRLGWLQVARGEVNVNGHTLKAGDGAAFRDEPAISISGGKDAEVLLFDMTR